MNLLFCILRSLPGTFVHVLILGLKELKVDYLVMPAWTKSLIVQEIKTDSGLAWIYMYFTLVLLKLSTKKIKQKQKEHVHVVSILIKDQLLYQILQLIKRPETPEMNEY